MAQVNASAASSSASSEAPRGGFHFPWRPFSARFRVMVQLADYRVALVSMARSRREAVQIARQWAEDHMEAEADTDSESSLAVVSVYTEQWIEGEQGGRWEVLRRADGGYYRGFRPKDRRPRPDRRRRDQLGGW